MNRIKQWLKRFKELRKKTDRPGLTTIKGGQEQVGMVKVDQAFCQRGNRKLIRRQLGCKGPLIISVAGLEKDNGILLLLKAYRLLVHKKKLSSDILLLITHCEQDKLVTGQNWPCDPEVQRLLEGIEDCVKFFGPQSKERLATLYSAANATVIPVQQEQSILDAQACGSPVITVMESGKQLVLDGETGLIVNEEPEDMSLAMEAIILNEILAKRMGKQAAMRMKQLTGQAVST